MTQKTNPVSEHNVLAEFDATSGRQTHNQRAYFIATMTREDVAKITLQLMDKQCAEVSISEGDSYRRTLDNIIWERSFGGLSHLRKVRNTEKVIAMTKLEEDVLMNGIGNSDFTDTLGNPDVWSDCIIDTCKITTKDQISGVVSSLVKKNLVKVINTKSIASSVQLTPKGMELLNQRRRLT